MQLNILSMYINTVSIFDSGQSQIFFSDNGSLMQMLNTMWKALKLTPCISKSSTLLIIFN